MPPDPKPRMPPRVLSRRKKAAFSLVILITIFMVGDLVLQLIDWQLHGPHFGRALVQRRIEAAPAPADFVHTSEPEVAHPYVGFVLDPTDQEHVNQYGFLQIDGPVLKRSPDRFIVGITGGSVAMLLCETTADAIKDRLAMLLTAQRGQPVQVQLICCAQQGFRQPQQLMTWTYFNSLGTEFDCLVNLDGFNEVALFPYESPKDTPCFFYPRKWDMRVFNEEDGELNRVLYRSKWIRATRQSWAEWMSFADAFPARIPIQLWSARDSLLKAELIELGSQLTKLREQQKTKYSASGPVRVFSDADERMTALVQNWSHNSHVLSGFCQSQRTTYVHVLQPNLHLKGSKPFTKEEREYVDTGSNYATGATQGYPLLRESGERLAQEQVHFFDGTPLFSEIEETVYSDSCCHLNSYGNSVLGDFICDCILQAIASESPPKVE